MYKPQKYSNTRLREIVEDYVHDERNRKILIRKYCDNRTIEQLADEFFLSESQIKRILVKEGIMVFDIMSQE